MDEVVLVPIVVQVLGVGWISFGTLWPRRAPLTEPTSIVRLAMTAGALLLFSGYFAAC